MTEEQDVEDANKGENEPLQTFPTDEANAGSEAVDIELQTESPPQPIRQSSDTELVEKCEAPSGPGPCCYKSLPGPFQYKTHLECWTVSATETGEKFWNLYGNAVSTKNLVISIGNLLLAFAVWLIWSIITVLILNSWTASDGAYFHFSSWKEDMSVTEYKSALWVIPATAGLSGATLRLTNSFMVAPSGGRNVISQTSILLLIPMIMLAAALNDTNSSLEYFIVIALISGAGGGAFASSMSNISFFYPKAKQGLALGLNAGIGNLGVSVMQILIPAVVSYAAFGKSASIYIEGVGYIANAALIWIPFLIIFIIGAWFFMNSLPQHTGAGNTVKALISFYWLEFLGYVGAGISVVVLISTRSFMSDPGLNIIQAFVLWFIAVVITVLCMKFLICCKFLKNANENIQKTFAVLSMKHTWIMTYLYVMTFGSFIGFSASFAMLMKELFVDIDPLSYAWLGPFVGSIARPLGGWMSDRWGGARVTHYDVIVMILSTVAVGITIIFARDNQDLFPLFLILFLVLFITTGIGNGSTFRMVPIIFTNKEHAGPVLGWTSAIAAYGAFVIPIIFSAAIEVEIAEWAFFAFAIYYSTCLIVNWYYYSRKNAEIPC